MYTKFIGLTVAVLIMLVFSAVPLLNQEFKKFRYIWFVFACLVAFSRAYFGVHYVSDVMVGAVIGYLIGLSMVMIEKSIV